MTTQIGRPEGEAPPQDGAPIEHWTMAGTVHGPLSRWQAESLVEGEAVTHADPTPLGLVALASATITVGAVFAGWFGPLGMLIAIPVLLVVGGVGMFLAGMWAFRRGDVLTASAFSALGTLYAALALLFWLISSRLVLATAAFTGALGTAGIFLLTFALITAGLGVAALRVNLLLSGVFFVLALAYLCMGIGIWAMPSYWLDLINDGASTTNASPHWLLAIGGYLGILAALAALYQAIAIITNSASRYEVLPVFQRWPQAWRA
ncbi:MAG TPA: GPR1/FUN34/YaaH family transporter [Ktedonobacterales bacterium]